MEREVLECDILVVGAGPAGLSFCYQLSKLLKKENMFDKVSIVVLEKAETLGTHILSGAIIDPIGLKELEPDFLKKGFPYLSEVKEDMFYFLTKTKKIKLPYIPSYLKNNGYYVCSLSEVVKWLGKLVESEGINIFYGFAGFKPLFENGNLVGIQTQDKGVDKSWRPKTNFTAGIIIKPKLTVLAEGVRGSLTKELTEYYKLSHNKNPQIYAIGVKEVWKSKNDVPRGLVIDTMGFPLDFKTFGGGFLYTGKDNIVQMGLVIGLDYENPYLDPHYKFQQWKTHPFIRSFIDGGQLISYGAKAIPEGGLLSIIKNYGNNFLIIGDSAGFLNNKRLKGVHLAIKTGIIAANVALDAIKHNDFSENTLSKFWSIFENSWAHEELKLARNFRQAFDKGILLGLARTLFQDIFKGTDLCAYNLTSEDGYKKMKYIDKVEKIDMSMPFDGQLTFNKLSDVYYAKTIHPEDQPSHLVILNPSICADRCTKEYGNPCQYFCPASVYEIVDAYVSPRASEISTPPKENQKKLHINFSNCVHCKTCDIMDPYQIIKWIPPPQGGPNYYLT